MTGKEIAELLPVLWQAGPYGSSKGVESGSQKVLIASWVSVANNRDRELRTSAADESRAPPCDRVIQRLVVMRRGGGSALLKSTGKRKADVTAPASKAKAPRVVVSNAAPLSSAL